MEFGARHWAPRSAFCQLSPSHCRPPPGDRIEVIASRLHGSIAEKIGRWGAWYLHGSTVETESSRSVASIISLRSSRSRRIERLRLGEHVLADEPVARCLGDQVDPSTEQGLALILQTVRLRKRFQARELQ